MQKLPAVVKARAAGGTAQPNAPISSVLSTSFTTPEDTFGVLRTLLQALEEPSQLRAARRRTAGGAGCARRRRSGRPTAGSPAPSAAAPIRSPASGRSIRASTSRRRKGQPVYATANGTVESAAYTGDYGNLIVVQHDFGLSTRYGHLSKFNVKPGQSVKRGDIIGFVGSTGRSTGAHLHYEILANGKLINPLPLLTEKRP